MSKAAFGYWGAVVWIANNDEYPCRDIEVISGLLTVLLLADMYGKEPRDVAFDVYAYRTGARNRFTAGI